MNRFSLPPARRFLAVDAGRRCLKALLVSNVFGRLRIHAHRIIGLDDSSQPGAPGWARVLHELRDELGDHPLIISVPQSITDSQVLDLPGADAPTIRDQIQGDVVKLRGLTESAIIYDFGPLRPFAQYANPYWVTHTRESEILDVVRHFESDTSSVWEISSTANALVAAFREAGTAAEHVLLVEVGASATVVALIYQGQGVSVASFAIGGRTFSELIQAARRCPAMEAEFTKNTEDLLSGDHAMPALRQLVDRWHGELVRILEDWLSEHPRLNLAASQFEIILSGGEAEMPGLVDYLRANSVLTFSRWAERAGLPEVQPAGQFAVAFGLACLFYRRGGPATSLVPAEMRQAHKEHHAVQMLHAGTWLVLIITALVLAFGTWQKYFLIQEVECQLGKAEEVLARALKTDRLKLQLANEYEVIRPLLARQRDTVAALATLGLLAHQALPTNVWFVLFADADSYYSDTNSTATNGTASAGLRLTNAFIAELSTSMNAAAARTALSEMIDRFKKDPLFRKVDILAPDQRRRLAKDAVVVPDGHYALSFTMNDNEHLKPLLSAEEIRRLTAAVDPGRSNALRNPSLPPPRRTFSP